jgi:hypothetical protein
MKNVGIPQGSTPFFFYIALTKHSYLNVPWMESGVASLIHPRVQSCMS